MAEITKLDAWNAALYVQEKSGLHAEYFYRQWAHESGYFKSRLARNNYNLGGLTQRTPNGDENKQPDGTNWYCKFENLQEYAQHYYNGFIHVYEKKEEVESLTQIVKSLEDFVLLLKKHGYFGDSVENYLNGLQGISLDGVAEPTINNPHGDKIIEAAKKHLGHPYSMDSCCQLCTGFVYKAYKDAGIDFDTVSGLSGNFMLVDKFYTWAKSTEYFSEDKSCMLAGDIIIGNDKGHVAIYMGDGSIIHNSSSQEKVVIADGSWMIDASSFNGFVRIGSDLPLTTKASDVKGSSGTKYSSVLGMFSSEYDESGGFTEKNQGKNWTIHMNKKDKTLSEPVYPDYITLTNNIPGAFYDNKDLAGAAINSTITLDDMTQGVVDATKLGNMLGLTSEIMNSLSEYRKRQIVFDATKHRNSIKAPNAGAPKNPSDPYPVDSKIEELETHLKRVKLSKIKLFDPKKADKQLAKYIIEVSDAAEKRIVKLENILATITRYLFAMGSRIHINCQYYGGQDRFQKYTCIRCLKDDLINDGQVVQIDQCLNCDRYEPIIGQVYDIVNETGYNLAALHDDMQSSMMSMDQYVRMTRIDESPGKLESTQFPTSKLTTREAEDVSFAEDKGRWGDGQGIKMDWTLTPVEEQKPQVNWQQDINDTTDPKRVGSYQLDPANMQDYFNNAVHGVSIGIAAGSMKEFFETSYANIKADPTLRAAFPENLYQQQADKVVAAAENMRKYNYCDALVKAASEAGLDPLFIFAIITRESNGVPGNIGQVEGASGTQSIEDQFKGMCSVMKSKFDNPNWKSYVTKIQAYNSLYPEEFFTSYSSPAYDLAYYTALLEYSKDMTHHSIIMEYVPNVIFSYIAALENDELMKTLRANTIYKEGKLAVPYARENFGKVYFTSPWGWRPSTGTNHAGWDFSTGANTPIIAAADGKCVLHREGEKGYGNYIVIEHEPGLQTLYAHMKDPSPIQEGQEVKEGDFVGYEGQSGGNYPIHLHFGVYHNFYGGKGDFKNSRDPIEFYPQFSGQKGKVLTSFLEGK